MTRSQTGVEVAVWTPTYWLIQPSKYAVTRNMTRLMDSTTRIFSDVSILVESGESLSLTRKNSPENRLTTTAASNINTMAFIDYPMTLDRAV